MEGRTLRKSPANVAADLACRAEHEHSLIHLAAILNMHNIKTKRKNESSAKRGNRCAAYRRGRRLNWRVLGGGWSGSHSVALALEHGTVTFGGEEK